jgi:protein-S-isoprenylcysteine O-methyltransferase Ste14
VILVPAGVAMLLSRPAVGAGLFLDVALDLVAWILFVAGGALRLWATLYVGGRKGRVVVAEGPYSLCRNPLYLGTILLAVSFSVFLKSVTMVVGTALVGVLYAAFTIPAEEKHLAGRFGEPYRDYCERTPRLVPNPAAFHAGRMIETDVSALYREIKKAVGWISLPFLAELITHLRQTPNWPSIFNLP